jgi:3',5'-cyclic-AMP phosphodiesterase
MSQPDPRPLKVVQITDLHLGLRTGAMYGVAIDTDSTLAAVLQDIGRQAPDADLMLVTGDLAEDPVAGTYERLREALSGQPMPVHCLAGNHDNPALMERILQGPRPTCARVVTCGAWIIVLLDSTVPGQTGGALNDDELALLEESLASHPARNGLICVHHPVMPVGCRWLDRLGLANADALFRVTDRHERVRGILFGHAHQHFEAERRGVRILGTPSTCLQFLPGSDNFALDTLPPAWRELLLHPDGRIDTRVVYLDDRSPALRSASR